MNINNLTIIYDQDCPICNYFACTIGQSDKNIMIVNGRRSSSLLDEASKQGVDIDKGGIVFYNNKYYFGYKAFLLVANITNAKGWLGVTNQYFFKHHYIAKFLYPFFTLLRRIMLIILRKPLINAKAYE